MPIVVILKRIFSNYFLLTNRSSIFFFTDPIKKTHEYTRRIRGTDPSSKKFRYFQIDMKRLSTWEEAIQHLRFSNIESKLIEHDQKFNQIFSALEKNKLPQKGIFFDGQIFDAYTFAADLVRKAKLSLILIDNYITCIRIHIIYNK